jgi:hypothetical protein
METPMVATRVGGLIDTVVDGETGILVAPDDFASLAKGILTILRDSDRARQLAKRGRQFMLERFTLRKTVENEHALYQRLLLQSPHGYRLHRTFGRLFSGAVVSSYLAARYRFIDAWLFPRLDSGWRPWHFDRTGRFVIRMMRKSLYRFYGFVGRRKLGWGLRRRASRMFRSLYRHK